MARAALEICYGDAPLEHKFYLTLDTYTPRQLPVRLMWAYPEPVPQPRERRPRK